MIKFISIECRFIEPLIVGDYPKSMRERVGNRLPRFSTDESRQVKGSFDFIGINHYTTWYASKDNINIIGGLLNDSQADSGAFTLRMSKNFTHTFCFSRLLHLSTLDSLLLQPWHWESLHVTRYALAFMHLSYANS